MKLNVAKSGMRGLTHLDLIMVLGLVACIFFFFFFLILPVEQASKRHDQRIYCVNNLKQMSMSYLAWANDHGKKFPMETSVANGGAKELIATGNVAACFEIMSNELYDPKILNCPADLIHPVAVSFTNGLSNSNISYFVSLHADESSPQKLLSGDDDFEISGVPVRSGLLQFSTNAPIQWDLSRHGFGSMGVGNLSFADGRVEELSWNGLQFAIQSSVQGTDTTSNRLVIP